MKKKPILSRRKFMKLMAVGGTAYLARSPVDLLLDSIVQGFIERSKAEETGVDRLPRNYVFVHLIGGPARWHFDLPLVLNKEQQIRTNRMIANCFEFADDGSIAEYSYRTHGVVSAGREILLPYIWGSSVPAANGGTRRMDELLDSAAFLRGCDLINDGHIANRILQHRTNPAQPSLGGLVVDRSTAPVAGVNCNGIGGFASASGLAELPVSIDGNSLESIFDVFDFRRQGTFREKETAYAAIDRATSLLEGYSLLNLPGAEGLFRTRREAEKLFRREIGNLSDIWSQLYGKYLDLISRALKDFSVAGISDRPLYLSGSALQTDFQINGIDGIVQFPEDLDARSYLQSDKLQIEALAQGMAVAEYVLTQGLSASVQVLSANMSNLVAGNSLISHDQDQHDTGVAMSILLNSQYWRALSACLLEFRDQLRATKSADGSANLFDETVIHIAGEFNRSARDDGSGSDHGFNGNVVSLFSGALQGLSVAGNIMVETPMAGYSGTWGYAAAMESLQNRSMGIGNIGSTIAELLRVPSPNPNDPSLLVRSGSKYQTVDEALNVV